MKKLAYQIRITKPCTQNWAEMEPVEKGRFCQQCSKTVIDFSSKSDAEILRIYQQSNGLLCGRFKNEQLEKPIYSLPKENSRAPMRWIASILFWFNLEPLNSQVQDPPKMEIDSLSKALDSTVLEPIENKTDQDSSKMSDIKGSDSLNLTIPSVQLLDLESIIGIEPMFLGGFGMEPHYPMIDWNNILKFNPVTKLLVPKEAVQSPVVEVSQPSQNITFKKAAPRIKVKPPKSILLFILKYVLFFGIIALFLKYFSSILKRQKSANS